MSFDAKVVRIFLASPGDVKGDREVARSTIAAWNAEHAQHHGVVLMPVGWETDATPEWGEHPQAVLNRQLVDQCDAIVGVFWTRLGTPTPKGTSGTAEEIERCAAAGKAVLLYFCRKDPSMEQLEPDQLRAVREFEAKVRETALYDNYCDWAEFKAKLSRALTRLVREKFGTANIGVAGGESVGATSDSAVPKGRRLGSPPVPKREARLTARLENTGRQNHRLVLANLGTIEMKNVNVQVPEIAKSFALLTSELPIDVLRPGERVALLASVHMGGGASIFDVMVTGTTPDGESLSFPSKISI